MENIERRGRTVRINGSIRLSRNSRNIGARHSATAGGDLDGAFMLANGNQQFKLLSRKIGDASSLKASSRGFQKSLFKKLAARIEEKPLSFYVYGLKKDEKRACKRVFHEIFDVICHSNVGPRQEARRHPFSH